MANKYKVTFYSGPQDGLYLYWDEIDQERVYFEYTSISRAMKPDFSNFEYHVYKLEDVKNSDEIKFIYSGVSQLDPQDDA